MPTVGGETQTKMIKVLQLATDGFRAEFRNIKVDRVSKNLTAVASPTPNPVATPSSSPIASPVPTPHLDTSKRN